MKSAARRFARGAFVLRGVPALRGAPVLRGSAALRGAIRAAALLLTAAAVPTAAPAQGAAPSADAPPPPLAARPACAPEVVDLRGPGGATRFAVEIADTPETRAQGLMHREYMAPDAGMLFLFDPVRPVAFWMRNTILPLDLLFIDASGTVVKIHENAVPYSERFMPSGAPVRAVLEVNAGLSEKLGLAPGTRVRHPGFGPGAAWPCAGQGAETPRGAWQEGRGPVSGGPDGA